MIAEESTQEESKEPSLAEMIAALVDVEKQVSAIRKNLLAYHIKRESPAANHGNARLLNAVIKILGLANDAALSRFLGVAPPVISKIRNNLLPVGPSVLIRMHEETGLSIRELKSYLDPEQIESTEA
jgi:hypothetical protein